MKSPPEVDRPRRQPGAEVAEREDGADRITTARFTVICSRHDGREKIWRTYADESQAQFAAKRLNAIGIKARVVDRATQP